MQKEIPHFKPNIMNLLSNFNQRLSIILPLIMIMMLACQPRQQEEQWVQLFNGENLDGWDIKIRGYELNENFGNTFRVEDGIMKISYDEYDDFGDRFGHIYYHKPFSHYKLRIEYRFVGEQVNGGAGWAYRNNGIMFHSQSAHEIEFDQSFPNSVEAQMLGGDGVNERSNGNVCTPGTTIEINGVRIYDHCTSSDSRTFHGDGWITFELVVYGDSLVHHILEGDTVMTYGKLQLESDGSPLSKGYIALQAESHPTEFRKIEILELLPENK
jgi:hypothetical protein